VRFHANPCWMKQDAAGLAELLGRLALLGCRLLRGCFLGALFALDRHQHFLRRPKPCAPSWLVSPARPTPGGYSYAGRPIRSTTFSPRGRALTMTGFPVLRMMSAQRPYKPVNVALAKVWKCRSNPTSAAEAASFLASGSLSTSTAKTVIW
jgi:hypothetical protein